MDCYNCQFRKDSERYKDNLQTFKSIVSFEMMVLQKHLAKDTPKDVLALLNELSAIAALPVDEMPSKSDLLAELRTAFQ